MRPRAAFLKERCPKDKTKVGITVFRVINKDLPEILIYRGDAGDYVVADDFCTCPSFLKSLDSESPEPCKHICAEKRFTKSTTLILDDEEFDTLLLSLLTSQRSVTLNLLLSRYEGGSRGEEEKEEENNL